MGALKRQEPGYEPAAFKNSRPPTHPDYSDEVTDQQMDDLRRRLKPVIEADEWVLEDGPAW